MKLLPHYVSLRVKMLVVIVIRISIVFVVLYLWLYLFLTQSAGEAGASALGARLLQARDNLLPLLGLVYVLLSSSVWFITGNLTRTLRELDQASRRVGEGDYTPITIRPGIFQDEITHFTVTLNQMIEKVRGREENLRKQVEKLTIQVDEARRHQSVQEVVDTDFFRDLKSKAKDMREHHGGEETSPS